MLSLKKISPKFKISLTKYQGANLNSEITNLKFYVSMCLCGKINKKTSI